MPVKLTFSGLLAALVATVIEPDVVLAAAGVKFTVKTQDPPAARLVPQVFV